MGNWKRNFQSNCTVTWQLSQSWLCLRFWLVWTEVNRLRKHRISFLCFIMFMWDTLAIHINILTSVSFLPLFYSVTLSEKKKQTKGWKSARTQELLHNLLTYICSSELMAEYKQFLNSKGTNSHNLAQENLYPLQGLSPIPIRRDGRTTKSQVGRRAHELGINWMPHITPSKNTLRISLQFFSVKKVLYMKAVSGEHAVFEPTTSLAQAWVSKMSAFILSEVHLTGLSLEHISKAICNIQSPTCTWDI